jgi:hypothetical protein
VDVDPTPYAALRGNMILRYAAGSNFTVEYLGKFETDFKNILWCLFGASG